MIKVYVQGVSVLAPGLNGWQASRAILAGQVPYRTEPLPRVTPEILPAAERRRSSESVRLAVTVAQEAMNQSSLPLNGVATVFASSDGDGQTLHQICEALARPEHDVSPTRFHNSVHNAAAGYWSIATGSKLPSNSLCAFDDSFAIGLLEAATQVVVERVPVLLVAFDLPFPQPLHQVRAVSQVFACAFLLVADSAPAGLGLWEISIENGTAPIALPEIFDGLGSNPAARALPLLQNLARQQDGTVRLGCLGRRDVVVKCSR